MTPMLPPPEPSAVAALVAILAASARGKIGRPDLTLADFEGEGYQPWVVRGRSVRFKAPLAGTAPGPDGRRGVRGEGPGQFIPSVATTRPAR